ncbi:hypothetical protein BAE44_0001903 [Dichanthelium oligosanthes]|uniref:Uncharacterized protein n=1 Tax=Dichanthelium oligosanthes TaxID=888268 RepID=A0A1E5WI81_9POAL|nr:hypothetical protein BAE44_0001903 [Dichanthelium oligosanthes]
MGRPRATPAAAATASRPRRNPKPKTDPSFLSPLASPAPPSRTRTRKRAVRGVVSSPSSPASSSPGSSSPADLGISFLSSPGSSASSPKPKPKARAKPAARSPRVASPRVAASPPPPAASPKPASPAAAAAAVAGVSSVGDLRSAVASRMEDLKRRLDAHNSRAHADLDASFSRVSKRIKTQNQACQQLTDEVDKEYKKMSDNIKESSEIVKAKYKQIIAEAQSSMARGTTHILQNLSSLSLLLNTTVLLPKSTGARLQNMDITKFVIGGRQDISIIMFCFSGLTLMIRLILNCLAVNIYCRFEQ